MGAAVTALAEGLLRFVGALLLACLLLTALAMGWS